MPQASIYEEIEKLSSVEEKVRALIRSSWDMRRSYPKDALELSLQARSLAEKNNFTEGIAYSFRNSGTCYYLLSQYNHALVDLEKALLLFEELNDQHAVATTLRNIGNVYHSMNLFEQAIGLYNRALAIARGENDAQGMAYNLGNLGHVYQKMENFQEAKSFMHEGKTILETINDQLGLADLLNNLGNVCIATGEFETGLAHISRAHEIAKSINHLRGIADTHRSQGKYFSGKNEFEKALSFFRAGLTVAEEMGELALICDILKLLSETFEAAGHFRDALACYKEFEKRKSELQQYDQQVMLDTLKIKSQMEKSAIEKAHLEEQNAELEKAREELERLSIVARQTENSILILDADGTLEWVNASFEKLNGLTLAEFKKQYGSTIYEVSNNPEIRGIIENCVRTKTTVRYEAPNYLDDGSVVWESSTLTPIFRDSGELFKLIIIDTDVTERKNAEELVRQKDITDSIHYARYLQEAILPSENGLKNYFEESFIFFRPKDIVSGDFFWFAGANGVSLVAAADCTGHGVPGAMMSILGNEMLELAVRDPSVQIPAATLDIIQDKVKEVFAHKNRDMQDGMDIGLLVWHYEEGYVQYAAARRPLVIVRNGAVLETPGDRYSIGGRETDDNRLFTEKVVPVQKGDMLYLFSDGYPDQFGGPTGKKFMYRNFIRLLVKIAELPVELQRDELEATLDNWRGELEQVDDVLVIGIRIR